MIRNLMFSSLIGAVLFIAWHFYIDLSWSREASYDIMSGAILEFFLFQTLLYFHGQQQQKNFQKHMKDHLAEIEKLLKKG